MCRKPHRASRTVIFEFLFSIVRIVVTVHSQCCASRRNSHSAILVHTHTITETTYMGLKRFHQFAAECFIICENLFTLFDAERNWSACDVYRRYITRRTLFYCSLRSPCPMPYPISIVCRAKNLAERKCYSLGW